MRNFFVISLALPFSFPTFAMSEDKQQRRGTTAERLTKVQRDFSATPICRYLPRLGVVLLTTNLES